MEDNYKYKQKLLKIGNSRGIIVPADWLEAQFKKLLVKGLENLDVLIFDDKLEIRAVKKK